MSRFSVLTAMAAVLLALCSSAQATTTIGHLAPPNPPTECTNGPADLLQTFASSGAAYTAPTAGVITSWSTSAGAGLGQTLKLKVFRPVSGLSYEVVGHDGPRLLAPSSINTFAVSIPVKAGDVIGLNDQNAIAAPNACYFAASPADSITALSGDTESGPITFPGALPKAKVNVSAILDPAVPVVASVSPASGSIKGGTAVTISGANFIEISGVSFGGVPATSFGRSSDATILAVVPAGKKPGKVDVTVTGITGTSVPTVADQFTYRACVVPKLKGKSLKVVRKKLKKAGCKLGNVKGEKSKAARVKHQSAKPGKVLSPGAKVNVRLG